MRTLYLVLLCLLTLASPIAAQFGSFFDQMFGGHGGHGHQQTQQQQQHQGHGHQQHPNVPSDPSIYQANYQRAHCDKYLCPDTLACVHYPHHCPCPWPLHEDKAELAEGQRICVSKGGFKVGEAARKIELARKGML
ncbi:hypothetical protein NEUTE1DRAFT_59120 [Neurospora tetrasperma FGSC 2508]|uniref:Long chronological lifespan protein 2 n=1 Tax=Neurospora tetrasperma (strain FGSC 2508 / ATCC MYA-4615 / P0657) TaxID=510951 RepID=F8MEP5_NEUT8|nr:uncharacterized protein NEUTE1DRAFT_59120 [Neurospora tetrasperma FGSC 2508]EGO61674.1 hypothetical protein NEUTE1DRAFT_59120 [Neurospora tetrasperma FGSC 2508]EGZ74275.1 hypothetical protein NEUTE2DRAFT_102937 [Neurospora tetrasperma FGSC 2509]